MNKIDETALRIAKNVFNTETHRAWSYEGGDEEIKEFAHALLAELSKDVEPSLYRWKTGHNFEYQFSEQRENAPEYATKYFTHPAPVIASEKKPVAFTNSCELEYLDFKRADGGLVTGAMWKEWDNGADISLFTSPPNTAEIEQRVAEACAKYCDNLKTYHVETGRPVLASVAEHAAHYLRGGKWREYL